MNEYPAKTSTTSDHSMTMMPKIRTAKLRSPIARLVPTTTPLICLLVIFLLEQGEAFVAEASFIQAGSTTSSGSTSSNIVRTPATVITLPKKSTFGRMRRSLLSTNLFADDADDSSSSSSSNSSSSSSSNNYNDEIALTQFLQKARDRALEAFATQEAPSWMIDNTGSTGSTNTDTATADTLPFSCTGCGKCCQTTGSVYMSPKEYNQAADYLNVTAEVFVQTYASHTLAAVAAKPPSAGAVVSVPDTYTDTDTAAATTAAIAAAAAEPWICIKDNHHHHHHPTTSEPSDDADADDTSSAAPPAACIFLDRTSNHCQIYPVRPVQCRTYPFWPTVTASVQSWNAECRRLESAATASDSVSDSDRDVVDSSSALPRWTPDLGGCEGMRLVGVEDSSTTPTASIGNDDFITSTTGAATATATTTKKKELDSQQWLESVPRQTALELLYEYVVEERRFPHEAKEVPIVQEVPVE